ncbi:MAG TPA: choice-of-anchor J domain-containing protein [Methylomirabilota bacterium]|nr:choice-of-anchor J domain-containing protein [Methylomirabilota bacterium]
MGIRTFVIVGIAAALCASPVLAQSFTEEFENITTLSAAGWAIDNNSTTIGSTSWGPIAEGMTPRDRGADFQGNDTVFPAFSGAPTGYIGDNFNATTGVGTISDWLMTPVVTIQNGDTVSFWTRTATGSSWPDRLQLRMSLAGTSVNCGTGPEDVGDFTTLLLEVNPTLAVGGYPEVWTQYSATIAGVGAPTQGRFAFRYYVTNGGPSGSNSNYIGVDLFEYGAVPVELQSFSIE